MAKMKAVMMTHCHTELWEAKGSARNSEMDSDGEEKVSESVTVWRQISAGADD